MSLVKTVELRILANAGDAQSKLDEIAAKGDEMGAKGIRLRFRVDDAAGKAQLDELRARADKLGFKDVSIKVRVDGAGRAIADLEAVKHEEDKVRDTGLLSKLGGLLGAFPGLGPVPGGAGGLAALAGGAAALLPEITGIVSGFAAAAAGAGSFALLAIPAVKHVETAYQGLNAAQQKYAQAQAKFAEAPTKANASALAQARLQLDLTRDSLARMPASEQAAVKGIDSLAAGFGKVSKAFEPKVFTVFTDALKVANNLLPAVTPFADTFATSVDGLLKRLGKFTEVPPKMKQSQWEHLTPFQKLQNMPPPPTGWQAFLKSFHSIEGPAVGAIGDGIGKVAVAIGKLVTTMSGKDVAHAINIGFGAVAGVITGIAGAVKLLMSVWDGVSARFSSNIHGIAKEFDTIRHGFAETGHSWAHTFDGLRHGAAAAWGAVAGFFSGLPGKIKGFFAGAGGWLVSHGSALINGLWNGAKSIWTTVSGWVSGLGGTIIGFFKNAGSWLWQAGKSIIQGLVNGMKSINLGDVVSSIASAIPGWMKHALGIHSPSLVMRGIGQQTGQGLILGLQDSVPGVLRASGQLAAATAGAYAASSARGAGHGGDVVINNYFGVVTDPQGTARQIHQLMMEYKRNGGRQPLGLG